MIKQFARYYKPHLKLFILDMVCAFTVSFCNLFYPRLAGSMIRAKDMNFVLTGAAVLLGIFMLKAGLNYIITYWGHVVGVRIQGDMRKELFAHLQKLPFSYYDDNKTGSIMSRLVNDLFEVSELAHHGPEDVFLSCITIIGALVMIYFINPWLTLILACILPILIFFTMRMRGELMRASEISREKTSEVNATVESAVSGVRVSKAYTAEKHENERFDFSNEEFKTAKRRQYRSMAKFNTTISFSLDVLYLVAFTAGGIFYFFDLIDVSGLTSYVLYISMLITPIRTFSTIFEELQDGISGFKRFKEVMSIPEESDEGKISVGVLKGDINFENVTFGYNSSDKARARSVIKNLSLSIKAGETVALVGSSGGGKTTLCNLIPRFYEIDGGKITVDGINAKDIPLKDLRRNIGIVQQDVFIFAGTVKENIAYGDFSATDEQIEEAAKKANIHDFILSLDKGYDTYVGERGVKLSGGQKQRIAIARAFLKNPPILILDEATSALDNVTEMQVQEALESLSKGRTTLVVAHRLSTVKNADEIIVLTNEGIVERGTHDYLMSLNGEYATLYRYQFKSTE